MGDLVWTLPEGESAKWKAPSGGSGGAVFVQDTDPGAVGTGAIWARTGGFSPGEGAYRQVYVRNAANDAWIESGLVHYDADGNLRMAVTTSDVATDITLWDAAGNITSQLSLGPDRTTLLSTTDGLIDLDLSGGAGPAGHGSLYNNPAGGGRGTAWSLHSGGVDGAEAEFDFAYGAIDPSVDPGLAMALGSLFARTFDSLDGAQLWFKSGVGDTDWTQMLVAPNLGAALIGYTADLFRYQDSGLAVFDGVARTGRVDCALTSLPVKVAPAGVIVSSPFTSFTFPTSSDAFDVFAHLRVQNIAGDQMIDLRAVVSSTPGDTELIVNWNDATVVAQTGSDLVWDDVAATVASTAGGSGFFVVMTAEGSWD